MRHASVLKRFVFSALAVASLNAAFAPQASASAELCRAVFARTALVTPLAQQVIDLEPRVWNERQIEWQNKVAAIKSGAELESLFKDLADQDKRGILKKEDYAVFHDIDFLSVIDRLPQADQPRMLDLGEQAALRFQSGIFSRVDLMLFPIAFVNKPERALRFVRGLNWYAEKNRTFQDEFDGRFGFSRISRTLLAVLARVPQSTKDAMIADLKIQIQSIDLNKEITLKDNAGNYRAPTARKHRRNVEVMLHFLMRPQLEQLEAKLLAAPNLEKVVDAMDEYYAQLDRVMAPRRGNYSFNRTLEVAETIRRNFAPALGHNQDMYIDIYGSLGNGKATIATSDVDVKLSHELLSAITGLSDADMQSQKQSPQFSDMINRNKSTLPPFGREFWNTYIATEQEIATNIFHREVEEPSETMTSFFPPIPQVRNSKDTRWYNPIVLRVRGDSIEIQIVDLVPKLQKTYVFSYRR